MKLLYTILLFCFCWVSAAPVVVTHRSGATPKCCVTTKSVVAQALSAVDDVEEFQGVVDQPEPAFSMELAGRVWGMEMPAPIATSFLRTLPDDTPLYLRIHTLLI